MLVKTVQKFVDVSLIVLLCMLWGNAGAGETTRVSLSTSGVQGMPAVVVMAPVGILRGIVSAQMVAG